MRKPEVCSFDTLRCYFEGNQEMYVLWKGVEGGQKETTVQIPRWQLSTVAPGKCCCQGIIEGMGGTRTTSGILLSQKSQPGTLLTAQRLVGRTEVGSPTKISVFPGVGFGPSTLEGAKFCPPLSRCLMLSSYLSVTSRVTISKHTEDFPSLGEFCQFCETNCPKSSRHIDQCMRESLVTDHLLFYFF